MLKGVSHQENWLLSAGMTGWWLQDKPGKQDVENSFLGKVLSFIWKESPHWVLVVIGQSCCHMAIPSCKGGWKLEYFASRPLYL